MKNHRYLIALIVLCISIALLTKPAHAILGVGDVVTDPIMDAWSAVKSAYDEAQDYIKEAEQNAKDWMDKQIANNMSDKQKADIEAKYNQALAEKMTDDYQKNLERWQKRVEDQAAANGEAAYQAIQNNKPSMLDCVAITNATVREYARQQNQAVALSAVQKDPTRTGQFTNSYSARSAAAAGYASNEKQIGSANGAPVGSAVCNGNNPDRMSLATNCTSDTSYNAAIAQMINNIGTISAGDPPPLKATMNPQMVDYFIRRSQWQDARGAALTTIGKLLPKMLKNKDLYNAALTDLTAADHNNASQATQDLANTYPNSANVGLSYYEFQEVEFNAMNNSGQTFMHASDTAGSNAKNGQLLQAQAAQLQIAKMERDELEAALKQLGVPAPPVSASALSVGSSSSSSTTTTGQ